MDVSHTEHSHVIGKGGNNIKKVMEETGCHIHFPDSNRNNQAEKSNQVSFLQVCLSTLAMDMGQGFVLFHIQKCSSNRTALHFEEKSAILPSYDGF